MHEKLSTDTQPLNYLNALSAVCDVLREDQDIYLANEGANTLDNARNIIDMYKSHRCPDCGTWGVMGIGMGYAIGANVTSGPPAVAIEGNSVLDFSGMEIETICRYNLPVTIVIFNNGGIYRGGGADLSGAGAPPPMDLSHHARYDRLMDAFRGPSYNVITTDELRHVLTTGIQSCKSIIINVIIDPAAGTESGHITKLNPE